MMLRRYDNMMITRLASRNNHHSSSSITTANRRIRIRQNPPYNHNGNSYQYDHHYRDQSSIGMRIPSGCCLRTTTTTTTTHNNSRNPTSYYHDGPDRYYYNNKSSKFIRYPITRTQYSPHQNNLNKYQYQEYDQSIIIIQNWKPTIHRNNPIDRDHRPVLYNDASSSASSSLSSRSTTAATNNRRHRRRIQDNSTSLLSWSLLFNSTTVASSVMNYHPYQSLIRWYSSNGTSNRNSNNSSSSNDKNIDHRNKDPTTTQQESSKVVMEEQMIRDNNVIKKEDHGSNKADSSNSTRNSNNNTKVLWNAQMEERFRHIVYDLYPGMLTSAVLLFLFMIPSIVQQMKLSTISSSSSTAVDIYEDPIDEFVKLARNEWDSTFTDDQDYIWWDHHTDNDSDDGERKTMNVLLQKIVIDVLNAKGVRDTAQEFILQIVTSESFKNALQHLIKELWSDLVNDPETLQQIIHILHLAIQDRTILLATQQLLIQLIDDPIIRKKLIDLIISLGEEQSIQDAVVQLLKESAHTTLSDPEILDHSMEFATDVVGDDIVQQTAGVALRNTVQHAFQTPVIIVVLTSIGITLLYFGMLSIGYSRSSDTDAVLIEHVVKSLQVNTRYGIQRIITWPVRAVTSITSYLYNTMIAPIIGTIYETFAQMTDSVITSMQNVLGGVIRGIQYNIHYMLIDIPSHIVSNIYQSITNMISHGVTSLLKIPSHIQSALQQMIISLLRESKEMMASWLYRTEGMWLHFVQDMSNWLVSSIQHNWDITLGHMALWEHQFLHTVQTMNIRIPYYHHDLHEAIQYVIERVDDMIVTIYWNIERIIQQQKRISLESSNQKEE